MNTVFFRGDRSLELDMEALSSRSLEWDMEALSSICFRKLIFGLHMYTKTVNARLAVVQVNVSELITRVYL